MKEEEETSWEGVQGEWEEQGEGNRGEGDGYVPQEALKKTKHLRLSSPSLIV